MRGAQRRFAPNLAIHWTIEAIPNRTFGLHAGSIAVGEIADIVRLISARRSRLRLKPDPSGTYALAAFCAASNPSRADAAPATCSVSSAPRFGVNVGLFVTLSVRVRQTPLADRVSDVGQRSQPELWRGETCRHATRQR